MSEDASPSVEARSAGSMLRAARERQGLHIAALAAAIKVPQAKLEALESGRYGELTDATFVRALALSVCRVLKIDAKPVLDLLPSAPGAMLEKVDTGLKAPFRERPGRIEPGESRIWRQPVFWFVLVMLAAAAAFLLWPKRAALMSAAAVRVDTPAAPAVPAAPAASPVTPDRAQPAPAVAAPPASAAPTATQAPTVVTETVHSVPAEAATAATAVAPSGLAVVKASEPSWVEVQDATGAVLLSRTLLPGESVGLDGVLPLRLIIGNASATEVTLRGKRVPMGAVTRDNVVRLELK